MLSMAPNSSFLLFHVNDKLSRRSRILFKFSAVRFLCLCPDDAHILYRCASAFSARRKNLCFPFTNIRLHVRCASSFYEIQLKQRDRFDSATFLRACVRVRFISRQEHVRTALDNLNVRSRQKWIRCLSFSHSFTWTSKFAWELCKTIKRKRQAEWQQQQHGNGNDVQTASAQRFYSTHTFSVHGIV